MHPSSPEHGTGTLLKSLLHYDILTNTVFKGYVGEITFGNIL